MNEPRIIKESVRQAIRDVVVKNKQRYTDQHRSQTWFTERYMYPIVVPGGMGVLLPFVGRNDLEIKGERILTDLSTLPEECYGAVLSRKEVYDAINKERHRQDEKSGPNKPQSLPGFLLILENELQEAKDAWVKTVKGERAPLNEIVQIAATAVRCLERYGATGSAIATNDIPENQR